MTTDKPHHLEQCWRALDAALPKFAPDEQRAALTLYRELAKGTPVSAERLATALEVPISTARDLLERASIRSLTYLDEDGRVLGFGGLAAAPMPHQFSYERSEGFVTFDTTLTSPEAILAELERMTDFSGTVRDTNRQ